MVDSFLPNLLTQPLVFSSLSIIDLSSISQTLGEINGGRSSVYLVFFDQVTIAYLRPVSIKQVWCRVSEPTCEKNLLAVLLNTYYVPFLWMMGRYLETCCWHILMQDFYNEIQTSDLYSEKSWPLASLRKVFVGRVSHSIVPRAYSWFFTYWLLLVEVGGLYMVLGIKLGSAECKASALWTVLLLWP